jgi:hypothetical protein
MRLPRGSRTSDRSDYARQRQLGEPAASVLWLQRAADTGFPCYPWFERDTLLEPVRHDPGFVRLLNRLRGARKATIRDSR